MKFLETLNPIGDAVILLICLFPMAINLYTVMKPKGQRRVTKSSFVTSFALLLIGFIVIYFRN